MPINAPVEYYKAEEKYLTAKTKPEKIACLEEMIRLLPKHKGSEHLLAQLKKKLAKLKEAREIKSGRKTPFSIKKEGAGQVCLFGLTNSGKNTLLKDLTGINVGIASHPYTTTKPQFGMMRFEDVWIQIVEIPSTFDPASMGIAHGTDLVAIVLDGEKNLDDQKNEIREVLWKRNINAKQVYVISKKPIDIEKLKNEIWKNLGKIRVYTKVAGRKPEQKPIILKKGARVEEVVKEIHKTFLHYFRFARIWGTSVSFPGCKVGLDHVLHDKDIIQIYA